MKYSSSRVMATFQQFTLRSIVLLYINQKEVYTKMVNGLGQGCGQVTTVKGVFKRRLKRVFISSHLSYTSVLCIRVFAWEQGNSFYTLSSVAKCWMPLLHVHCITDVSIYWWWAYHFTAISLALSSNSYIASIINFFYHCTMCPTQKKKKINY